MPDVLPSKSEIVRDLVRWFATEYGLELLESAFDSIEPAKLVDMWRSRAAKKKGSSGGAILLLLLFAFASSRKRNR